MAMSDAATPLTGPIPVVGARGWGTARSTLGIRNYRFVLASMMSGFIATWIARITQDWILLEMTQSVAAVGLAVTFQFAPVLVLGLWGGVITDRFPRLRIVRITQTITALGVLALAALMLLGILEVWHIYGFAVLTGLVAVAEGPARSALVTQIVPSGQLQGAIGMTATAFHVASFVGATTSGAVIALFGVRWALVAALAFAVLAAGALVFVRSAQLHPVAPLPHRTGLRAGLAYAYRKPAIRWPFVLIAFIATFGMTHTVLFAAAARDIGFDSGAAGYGFYLAMGSAGAVIGGFAAIGRKRIGMGPVVIAAVAFGAVMSLASAAVTESAFVVAVVLLSAVRIYCVTGIEALFQLSANPAMRGRVAGVYFVIVAAGQSVGPLLIGGAAESFGLQAAFALAGGLPLAAACIIGMMVVRSRGLRLRVVPRRWRMLALVPRESPLDGMATD
ncbi:MAG: MFS transporter [Microbacterium sp.]|nr:MAG: MFS transporter [Microbacterium sp.]